MVPNQHAAGAVWGNLGALLMSAGRLPEAVKALDSAVQATQQLPGSELYAGEQVLVCCSCCLQTRNACM